MQGTDHAVADIATLIDATLKDVQEGNEIKLPVNHPLITKWKDVLFEVFSRLDHEFGIFDSYNLPQISENGLYYMADINRYGLSGVLDWIQYGPLPPITVRDITLDLSMGKLSIGDQVKNILPAIDEMIFFTLLLKTPGHIVEYKKIAEAVGYQKRVPKQNWDDTKDDLSLLKRDMNYLRRDLRHHLAKVGFSHDAVENVMDRVMAVSGSGYLYKID